MTCFMEFVCSSEMHGFPLGDTISSHVPETYWWVNVLPSRLDVLSCIIVIRTLKSIFRAKQQIHLSDSSAAYAPLSLPHHYFCLQEIREKPGINYKVCSGWNLHRLGILSLFQHDSFSGTQYGISYFLFILGISPFSWWSNEAAGCMGLGSI